MPRNLGMLPKGLKPVELRCLRREEDGLETRIVDDLASNVMVVEPSRRRISRRAPRPGPNVV